MACKNEPKAKAISDDEMLLIKDGDTDQQLRNMTDSILLLSNFVSIQSIDTTIMIDLRYASENNFMEMRLYDTLQTAYLQKEVAVRLSLVQKYLDSIRPGFRLLVFDGVRPLNVQREMWEALDTVPIALRGKFVSNPSLGSVHNFGAAVDLTIVDSSGTALDMGAGYDDFRGIAFPSKEKIYLDSGLLSVQQYQNRVLLRRVMASQKFYNIPSEWWHFNAYSRYTAERKYPILLSESGDVEWSSRVKNFVQSRDSIRKDTSAITPE